MRLEICETVHTEDPEMVLRLLEDFSRDVSSDVVRHGHRLTLHGLGPSPRSKNRNDTTVFQVNAEDKKTIIDGEVNFQASALLGDQSQYDVVRSKLDRLFEQVKAQLDTAELPAAAPLRTQAKEMQAQEVPPVRPAPPAAKVRPEPEVEAVAEVAEPYWRPPLQRYEEELEEEGRGRLGGWMSAFVALLLIIMGCVFVYRHYYKKPATLQVKTTTPSATVADQTMQTSPITPHSQVEEASDATQPSTTPPLDMTPPAVTAEPSAVAPAQPSTDKEQREAVSAATEETPPKGVADPKAWLQEWASAMRTRDASAQAAFYADTVDSYLGQRNLSREEVLRERAATIKMRKGEWTVRMEKIVVLEQTESEAKIRLVKHFIDETEGAKVLELSVPSELGLRRVDGSWKIVSERDLPTSSAAFAPRG